MSGEFRFSTRKEYEDEIKKLLVLERKKTTIRKSGSLSFDDEYDALVEEYLRFCDLDA